MKEIIEKQNQELRNILDELQYSIDHKTTLNMRNLWNSISNTVSNSESELTSLQGEQEEECEHCMGTGYDGYDRCDPPARYICEECNGTGKKPKSVVKACQSTECYPEKFVEWCIGNIDEEEREEVDYCYSFWNNGNVFGCDTVEEMFNFWKERVNN